MEGRSLRLVTEREPGRIRSISLSHVGIGSLPGDHHLCDSVDGAVNSRVRETLGNAVSTAISTSDMQNA